MKQKQSGPRGGQAGTAQENTVRQNNTLLDAAMQYALRDWPVFPLHSLRQGVCSCGKTDCASPGKHPRLQHGFKAATTDPAQIKTWWTRWPDANIGIATGKVSGLLVIDLDRRDGKDGVQTFYEWQKAHGPAPDTLRQQTGGGGIHFIYAYPSDDEPAIKNATGVGEGVDVRADGGYIVVAPSVTTAAYQWLDGPSEPAPAPLWLLELVRGGATKTRQSKKDKNGAPSDGSIPEGKRNATLASLAGSLRQKGLSADEIRAALLEVNRRRCHPPLADDEVAAIADSIGRYEPGETAEASAKPAQAAELVELAADAILFHDGDTAYATIPAGAHFENYPVRSRSFRLWLVRRFYEQQRRPPAAQALLDALGVLESKALFDGLEQPVFVRVAESAGDYWLDLGDAAWQAVRVNATGWHVEPNCPIKFLRPRGMQALPQPMTGGSLDELRSFVNLDENDADGWALITSWLVGALRPRGPYPVLTVNGEQGSAKSTFSRLLKNLADPSTAPLRSEPRENRDLMIAANNSWLLVFDNLSQVQRWLSDSLCRLATGGGFSTRELFTDDAERIFEAMRPVLLNGIEELATRSDLLDRAVGLLLPTIPEHKRRPEAELWRAFELARPRILGALLNAVSMGMRRLPDVHLETLPRMADFAVWSVACEPALGLAPGAFLNAYAGNRAAAHGLAIEAALIGPPLLTFLNGRPFWTGMATDLLTELERYVSEQIRKNKEWPKTGRKLGGELRRLAPNLRAIGIQVEFERDSDKKRTRRIVIEQTGARPSEPSEPSDEPSRTLKNGDSVGRFVDGLPSEAAPDHPQPSAEQSASSLLKPVSDDADGLDGLAGEGVP